MRISIKELGSYLVGGILFASGLGVGLFKTGEFESLGIQIWIVMTLGTLERKSWRVSSGSSGSDKLNGQLIPRIWTGTAFLQQWWKFKKRRVLSLQSCCVELLQELLLLCNSLTNGRLGGQYSSCQGFWLWSFVASLLSSRLK